MASVLAGVLSALWGVASVVAAAVVVLQRSNYKRLVGLLFFMSLSLNFCVENMELEPVCSTMLN